jgi:putative ABC transport system permease protein
VAAVTRGIRSFTTLPYVFASLAGARGYLGLVGAVVVGQSLYAGTRDHLPEFATLRALGSSAGYIRRVILAQALLCAAIGCALGAVVGLLVVQFSAETAMPVVVTPRVALIILGVTFVMCCVGAISAIVKIMHLDPATVFAK